MTPSVRNITTNYQLTPADFQPASISQLNVSAATGPVTLTLPPTDVLEGASLWINITDATNGVTLASTSANIELGTPNHRLGIDTASAIALPGMTPYSLTLSESGGTWFTTA